MATLRVGLVSPEREIWSGEARQVVAQTVEGQIGILAGHEPVLGVLLDGSVVKIQPAGDGAEVTAMVGSGFFSVAADEVSILAEQAELSSEIDVDAARQALADAQARDDDEGAVLRRRATARLRAAGQEV